MCPTTRFMAWSLTHKKWALMCGKHKKMTRGHEKAHKTWLKIPSPHEQVLYKKNPVRSIANNTPLLMPTSRFYTFGRKKLQ